MREYIIATVFMVVMTLMAVGYCLFFRSASDPVPLTAVAIYLIEIVFLAFLMKFVLVKVRRFYEDNDKRKLKNKDRA